MKVVDIYLAALQLGEYPPLFTSTSVNIPQFQLGNIWSRDFFRPIACKQKYLMDYKAAYDLACEFFKQLKLSVLQQVQFQLFKRLTSANKFQIEF